MLDTEYTFDRKCWCYLSRDRVMIYEIEVIECDYDRPPLIHVYK